jgi:hypothetical protein
MCIGPAADEEILGGGTQQSGLQDHLLIPLRRRQIRDLASWTKVTE